MLLARRFYGDSLRFKREPNILTDIQFSSTEDMLNLVQGQSPSAVFLFEAVSAEDQEYFGKVTQIFTNQPAKAGTVYSVSEAYQAMVNWWGSLPIVARSLGFYEEADSPMAEMISQAKTKDPFRFIKHNLLEMVGQTPGEVLSDAKLVPIEVRLKAFKAMAEAVQSKVESQILTEFAKVFEAESHLDVDIQEAMKNWHNGLSNIQKDSLSSFHNNDSKTLAKFTSYANIRELLFTTLPEAYSLGKTSEWMSDYIPNYIQRVESGKTHIETKAPQIGALKVEFENVLGEHGNQVTYKGELILHADTEDGQGMIYYTEDGSDPKSSKQRQTLKPGDTLTINGNRKVKLTVADEKGNYSAVRIVEAIDELEKYSIKLPQQKAAFDETITFVFPKTKDAAQTTIDTFLKALKESGLYSDVELKQAIQDALDSLN